MDDVCFSFSFIRQHLMDSQNSSNVLRVLVFPWVAHGHITPYLELCKKLSKRKIYIYFCSTPANLVPVREKLKETDFIPSNSIELVELHLPSLPDLPPHHHTTNGLPLHLQDTLLRAFDMSSPSFYNILCTLKPDLLISDFLQPWAPALALSLNIPTVLFLVVGTISNYFLVNSLKGSGATVFPLRCNHIPDHQTTEGLAFGDRILQCLERSSALMFVKSLREIEGKYIDELSVLTSKKIVPVGPLVQDPSGEGENAEISEWLNKKEPSSVVFVSFGSEYYLSKEEREELAHGLLQSKVNFIWVLRFPKEEKINIKEALPEGFLEMVGERGLLVEDWAPQKRILAHPSVGGFVSHCGWGSVTESMTFGVPIIGMPMRIDQPLHARLVEEVGVGMEIKKEESTGRFGRKEIAKVINEVVLAKDGERMRKKAKEMSSCVRDGGDRWINEAIDELINLHGKITKTIVEAT
ncbi:hypothetical protein Tsubulata_736275 [Turnera subulata]|uniref:Glycosyltransferase n=1 Tax=Turnera subulata TaxID=218843 RepID=A0A9Q0G205_9ROSI|nr:hypothetical protein Tsubulata_736275 [Turnera subulata]